jgi:L-ascorbate metabolism protein UlaG (beta-lactamase superfamily)
MEQITEFTRKFKFVPALVVLWALLAAPAAPAAPDTTSDIPAEQGQAEIFYLYHTGWAVKTSSALMIFDYWERMQRPDQPSLASGFVVPEEIKEQDVYVFISHGHGDHFDERVLEWKRVIPNITYVFGWQGEDAKGHEAFGEERVTRSLGPLKVKNIFHDFDGIPESAFLIEVDGLTIYYSGDHGNAPGALHPVYKDNIDYVSRQSDGLDLVFLSIFGGPSYEGELYAIEKLKPRVMVPMHYGSREADAGDFVAVAQAKFPDVKFFYPLKQGDTYSIKK